MAGQPDVGMPLKAGELILSGSFTGGILADPGDNFEAVYSDALGCIRVNFEDTPNEASMA